MRLDAEEYREAFLKGYLAQLSEGNPAILKDFADRKLGKPVESVSVQASVTNDNPAKPLTTEELLAIAKATKSAP